LNTLKRPIEINAGMTGGERPKSVSHHEMLIERGKEENRTTSSTDQERASIRSGRRKEMKRKKAILHSSHWRRGGRGKEKSGGKGRLWRVRGGGGLSTRGD